ncbi:hypothetical protein [Pseudomonas nitroreducens]|uniref:hypothetical protein n=1 Tax=Pseudomonas nitroreducens TaxID=46680 RepID=UPI001FB60076|nr:hypothetical protein [Pseudomonas nitroreducens]MCJ1880742.1 hypothetical protein [Pseudomonas nitroreducens]MCJ1895740.1 hypothetical protein [Pseudomonas nitroreducens]
MKEGLDDKPGWIERGKTIRELILELESFEDQELLVELSVDGGGSSSPISLVGKKNGRCMLIYFDE